MLVLVRWCCSGKGKINAATGITFSLLQRIYTRSSNGIGRDCLTSLDGWLISLWMAIFRFSVFQLPFLLFHFPVSPSKTTNSYGTQKLEMAWDTRIRWQSIISHWLFLFAFTSTLKRAKENKRRRKYEDRARMRILLPKCVNQIIW